jgi:hypothetical protein
MFAGAGTVGCVSSEFNIVVSREENVPRAEALYEQHLEQLRAEGEIE